MTDGDDNCRNADNVFRGPGRITASTTSMGEHGLCLGLQLARACVLLCLNYDNGRTAGGRMMGTKMCTHNNQLIANEDDNPGLSSNVRALL